MNVMIVEDERRLGRALTEALGEFDIRTVLAGSGAEAGLALAGAPFDAIVLDLNLPDGDGLDLMRRWRADGLAAPVIVLSARASVEERIKGLNLGADDYLPKPFSVDELVARLRALGRRSGSASRTCFSHGPLSIDLVERVVRIDGQPLELTGREYALVEFFLRNPGRILPRTLIRDAVWQSKHAVENNLLDVYMSRLRQKVEAVAGRPLIRTIRGIGYQLI